MDIKVHSNKENLTIICYLNNTKIASNLPLDLRVVLDYLDINYTYLSPYKHNQLVASLVYNTNHPEIQQVRMNQAKALKLSISEQTNAPFERYIRTLTYFETRNQVEFTFNRKEIISGLKDYIKYLDLQTKPLLNPKEDNFWETF